MKHRDSRGVPAGHLRCGFTLIEVVTALAIGGIAVTLAAAMLAAVSDHTQRVADVARARDETVASERLLRRLVGQMSWSARDEPAPRGTPEALRFTTWCDVPAGWQERCIVELRVGKEGQPALGIEARLSTGETLRLLSGIEVHGFTYLVTPEHGGRWQTRWLDAASLPPIIGIVLARDTILLRTGERG